MPKPFIFLALILLASLLTGCSGNGVAQPDDAAPTSIPSKVESTTISDSVSKDPPKDCPLTVPQDPPFTALAPYAPTAPWEGLFWFGSEGLWTALPTDGIWAELPDNPEGYTQKIMWWSHSFSLEDEPVPALDVTGRRLDAEAPPLKFYGATNAFAGDIGEAMLTGVDFPTLGCWEITGLYQEAELSFVVWIAP